MCYSTVLRLALTMGTVQMPRNELKNQFDLERRWAAIEEKMRANSQWLIHRGTLAAKQAHGRQVWVVRFATEDANEQIQRTIYLGDQSELIQRAKALLSRFRSRRHWKREIAADVRLAVSAHAVL